MCLVTKAAVLVSGVTGCRPCGIDTCVNQTNCLGGSTMDECDCCSVCLKVRGEKCGGFWYRLGRCDHHLYCNITGPYRRDPVGECVPKPAYQQSNQRQYIPTLGQTTGAQLKPFHRYTSTIKDLHVPSTSGMPIILSLGTNETLRATQELVPKDPAKKEPLGSSAYDTTSSTTGSPTGNFVTGNRKNKGISKDSEPILNSPVDTKPAILFLIASGILLAVLVILVTCFDNKIKKRGRQERET